MTGPLWAKHYPEGVNAHFTPAPRTVPEFFASLTARHTGRVAFDYRDREISYATLRHEAGKVANGLLRLGLKRGDVVALYLPNTPFHPYVFFGALLAGLTITHLSPLDAFPELDFKFGDSGAKVLVTLQHAPFADMAMRLKASRPDLTVVLGDEDAAFGSIAGGLPRVPLPAGAMDYTALTDGMADTLPPVDTRPHDLALLQYTGGTTGRPKAAMLTHGNLTASVAIYGEWAKADEVWSAPGKTLLVLPLFHIYALSAVMLRRLDDGATLVMHQRFDLPKVVDDIEKKHIDSVPGVPTMWIAIINMPGIETRDFSALKRASSGGAPLAPEVSRRVKRLFDIDLRGGWGMTETAPAGINMPLDMPAAKIGTIGIPMPGLSVEIVDVADPSRVLPPGETGEMRIKGPNVLTSYWNRPQETAAAFRDGFFLTGDIGYMDTDGYVFLVDRKTDMIISGGYNIYPQMVENAILEHPAVAEAMVIGVPDDYRGEAAKAFVVLRPGHTLTLDELRTFLSERIGRHELPTALEVRDSLPRTAVGKYSRKMMREELKTSSAKP